jgi:hypothetical protein
MLFADHHLGIGMTGTHQAHRKVVNSRRGESNYYDSLAVYKDVLAREADGWRFAKRSYHYRFLDQNPFGGDAFPVTLAMGNCGPVMTTETEG